MAYNPAYLPEGSQLQDEQGNVYDPSQNPANPAIPKLNNPVQDLGPGGQLAGNPQGPVGGSLSPVASGLTRTNTKPFTGPSGQADPANPGYDTSGYLMGSKYDPSTGKLTIPNPKSGLTATSYVDPTTGAMTQNPATNANSLGVSSEATSPSTTSLDDLLQQLIKSQQASAADAASTRAGIRSRLDQVLNDASKPVSASDPQIAGPTNAFFAQGQRARALLQEKLAQEAANGGTPTGEVERGVNQSFSDLGNATGTYSANLMNNELAARRDELKSALSLQGGLLTSEEQQSLQQQLAAIEAQLNNQHFYDTLSTNLGGQASSLDQLLAQMLRGQPAA